MDNRDMEVALLRKLGDPELRGLLGASIVSAVEKSYNTNVESILAELLLYKFGDSLLENRKIRSAIIDVLDENQVTDFALQLSRDNKSYLDSARRVREYFSSSYSESKSKQFVDFIGFPEKYYKKVTVDLRTDTERVDVTYGENCKLKGYLHPYQKGVKDQILSSLINPGVRLMVQMPTGAGKTFTALETAVDILRRPFQNKFIVWLVNSNELAEQALTSFRELWKIKGDRPLNTFRFFNKFTPTFSAESLGGMVFASYDLFYSILNSNGGPRRESLLYLINNTEYLIVDEAHAAVAETYQDCVRAFISRDITQVVGLSATPIREDAEESEQLRSLFTGNLISIRGAEGEDIDHPISYLQDQGYLARIKVELLDTGVSCTEITEGAILDSLARNGDRNEQIIRQITYANSISDKTLVFACTKDHVLALYIMCRSRGVNVGFVTGDVNQSERLEILENFRIGTMNVLINLDILSTGIDLPNVNRLIITRPIRSSVLYSQVVGRALRGPKNGGNEVNTIINIQDNVIYFSEIALMYESFQHNWGA